MKPFIKWAGGKTKLLGQLVPLIPKDYNNYYEPFLGGGAVFFNLAPRKAFLSDINEELINLYVVVRDRANQLIQELRKYDSSEACYYECRNKDREPGYKFMTSVQRAARTLYLNKTCWNGLYRVNSKDQFNVPFGQRKNPNIIDEETILSCSYALRDVSLKVEDFKTVLEKSEKGDFVYLDPPYVPLNTTSFTSYTKDGFNWNDQLVLKDMCDELNKKGVRFMQSNSNSELVLDLYKDYTINTIYAPRFINSKGNERNKIEEVAITNYEISKQTRNWWEV